MIRTAPKIIPLLFLSLIFACRTTDPRGKAHGTDYYKKGFKCNKNLFSHGKGKKYLTDYKKVRDYFYADNKKRKHAFAVLTGDSTAMLFTPARLEKFLPKIDIQNRGIGGDTTLMLLKRLEKDILMLRPEIVIIAIGGVDILMGRCIPNILQNTKKMIKIIRNNSKKTKIVLVSVPPVFSWKANSITPFYNRKLERLAENDTRIHYLDLWQSLSRRDLPQLKNVFYIKLSDGRIDSVHFNQKGYKAWAQELLPVLKKN